MTKPPHTAFPTLPPRKLFADVAPKPSIKKAKVTEKKPKRRNVSRGTSKG